MTRKIFFTGGGSAGHVTPNIALMEYLRGRKWGVCYVGSTDGIDRNLIERLHIPYYGISTGKFRRPFSWKNLLDPFLVILGMVQSLILCLKYNPDIVFSKGGSVALPVVVGAWICKIPVISHESDIEPELASRIGFRFSRYVCIGFARTENSLPRKIRGSRTRLTGIPVRQSVLKGDASKGRELLGFTGNKPVLLVFGSNAASNLVNDYMRRCRFQLLRYYQIIHVVGEGNLDSKASDNKDYVQREYLYKEYGDVLAAADLVVSRAGAHSIYEFLLKRKCNLLIPLSKNVSRGHQSANAGLFEKAGLSMVMQEVDLTEENLIESLKLLRRQRKIKVAAMKRFKVRDSVRLISKLIVKTIKQVEEERA